MLRELSKVEQRYDAVLAVIREGMRVTEVAEKFGVHRDTVHSWLARYEAGGLEGLQDRSHRPKTSPLQMPAVIEVRVLELRRNRPHWGPMSLRHQLSREGVSPLPSVSGIYRALLRHGLIEPKASSQAAADLQTLGTWAPDGAVADGCGGRGAPRRRHRVQSAHRRRRSLPLLRLLRDHAPSHRTGGLRVLRPSTRVPRGARGDFN